MKLGLSRREIFILLVGWLFVCLGLVGVLYWFVRRGGSDSLAVSTPSVVPQATYTVEFTSQTAKGLLPLAQNQATVWRADAQLVSVTARWEKAALNVVGQPTTWTFRFYSPGLRRYYFVTVQAEGQVAGVSHGEPVRRAPALLALDQWVVDSPEAINLWLNYGGIQMLSETSDIQVVAQLSTPNPPGSSPTWTVAGYDSASDSYHTVFINAQSGEVLEVKSGTGS